MNKKEFTKAVLDIRLKMFLIHVAVLKVLEMTIYLTKLA